MKYKILCEYAPETLSREVEANLKGGWELLGTPFAVHEVADPGTLFCQAVVKYKSMFDYKET